MAFDLAPHVPYEGRILRVRRGSGDPPDPIKDAILLRLTIGEYPDGTILRLEGRLVGPWTSLVERCWRETAERTAKPVTVDLTAVTFVDDRGKMLLAEIHEHGGLLRTRGPLMDYIAEQIRNNAPSAQPSTAYLGSQGTS